MKYLMLGSVVGCSTCIGHYADLFSYQNGALKSDFSCNISYRAYANQEQGITYDAKTRLLLVEYETSDQSPDCQCEPETDEDEAKETDTETAATDTITTHQEEDEGKKYGKECRCEYFYNGETFVLKPVKKPRRKH